MLMFYYDFNLKAFIRFLKKTFVFVSKTVTRRTFSSNVRISVINVLRKFSSNVRISVINVLRK